MNTAEKLNIIMNITNTTNADLGQALHFDTSYVSRIRAGKRAIPKKIPFIDLAADYLSEQITEDFQITALSQVLFDGKPLPTDKSSLKSLIVGYLQNESTTIDISAEPVAKLLSGMSKMLENRSLQRLSKNNVVASNGEMPTEISPTEITKANTEKISVFYGNEGKRTAIKQFLITLCAEKRPFMLYLSSDEDMHWLIEDREFATEWMKLLTTLLQTGSRIQIIHHVNRSLAEMLNAIVQWSPLYMSGAIEPYYYPLIRDGIYRRSVFIAEGHSAIFATSVGENTVNMSNFLTYDEKLVASLKEEYSHYFSLCKPLMQIYTRKKGEDFMSGILQRSTSGKYLMAAPAPTVWSLFPEVAKTMFKRCGFENQVNTQRKIHSKFISLLESGVKITEIITRDSEKSPDSNAIPLPHCDLFGCPTLSYTKEEYELQLQKMEELSRKYDNYHVLTTDIIPSDLLIYTHSQGDAILSGSVPPTTAFVISQPQLCSAFFEYLSRVESYI